MRFVHTADVHLDACFASCGMPTRVGNRRRQSLRDVFHALVRRAADWRADALLIAGDLYDHERVSRDTVAFLRSEFESIRPVPVLIAPGNHDPYVPGSPYATETWPDNVTIFSKPEWTEHTLDDGRLCVHGFAFDGFEISSNPFGALRVPNDGALHVAVGHGSERAHQPPDGKSYAPFDAAAAAPPGLAYLALGHFHKLTAIRGEFQTVMYYPGAPEGHGFDETGPRYYLEVEIEEGAVRVTPVPSAKVLYLTRTFDCSTLITAQDVIDAVRGQAAAAGLRTVARITLAGACAPSIISELPAIYDALASEFEHLVLVDETIPSEDYEELARESSSLGAFLGKVNAEIRDAPDVARRRVLERAREVSLAAHRGQRLPINGLDFGGEGL